MLDKTLCFTGHRPNKLGGCYSLKHPESIKISSILEKNLQTIIDAEGVSRFISGGAIGFDQIAFWTIHKLQHLYPNIINVVAVPFKKQSSNWHNEETIFWYEKMISIADEVVYVDTLENYAINNVNVGEYHAAKMQARNRYMVDQSNYVFACWDGTRGGTENCLKYAVQKGRTLYQINPKNDYKFETN